MRLFLPESMPKFVTACALIVTVMAALIACDSNREGAASKAKKNKQAVGVKTKTGQLLTASEICAVPVVDPAGKTTIASLRFQENAVAFRRVNLMTNKSRFSVESEKKGTWGLVGDTLFITENGVTVQHTFDKFERESDKAPCFRFNTMENAPEFCACEF